MPKRNLFIYYISAMKKQPKNIPKKPGIYFFHEKKKIIYIGKARDLRPRIASYFTGHDPDTRKQKMVVAADSLTWRETESDVEALILEAELIKTHRPKYNILMRDDKQYLYVAFTKEGFPKIFFTHQPASSSSYIGPFTDAWAIRFIFKRVYP